MTDQQRDTIRQVFTRGQPLSVGKGEVIIGNDPEPNGVYYLSTGYLKAYSISEGGEQNTRLIFGSGEIFPITWAYLGVQSKSLFYETISDCVMWRISREWFINLISQELVISNVMAVQLAEQAKVFEDRVGNLEYRKARDRVIYRLLYLASRFGTRENNQIKIGVPITHEIFASTINLTRESASRELEKLEKEKLIEQVNHSIHITNVNGLINELSPAIDLADWRLA